jgi:CheY-like chemotaxis protein
MEPATISAWIKVGRYCLSLWPSRKHRVLVVEDDTLEIQLISYLLQRTKTPFDIVTTREGAIASARARQYSIALIDIRLQNGESGLQIAKELIRMNGNRRRFNVILTPGLMEDILSWPSGTLIGVLGKPITTESLEDALAMTRP